MDILLLTTPEDLSDEEKISLGKNEIIYVNNFVNLSTLFQIPVSNAYRKIRSFWRTQQWWRISDLKSVSISFKSLKNFT